MKDKLGQKVDHILAVIMYLIETCAILRVLLVFCMVARVFSMVARVLVVGQHSICHTVRQVAEILSP